MYTIQCLFLTILFFSPITTFYIKDNCIVSINDDLPEPQPLILEKNETGQYQFIVPNNDEGILTLRSGQHVYIACIGNRNWISATEISQHSKLTCVKDKQFLLDYEDSFQEHLDNLHCEINNPHSAFRTGGVCFENGTEFKIGFVAKNFVSTIDGCFDEEMKNTLYVHYKMSFAIGGVQRSVPRPGFSSGEFYENIPVSRMYKRKEQVNTLEKILDSRELAEEYIQETGNYFLAKGHLGTKTDFIFGIQQRATFFYINAAPQWQSFNGGNWLKVEEAGKDYAVRRIAKLDVYVGTFGILTLPDENNNEKKIFLYVDGEHNAIPVPFYFWKIFYNGESKSGIVFIGINNPYLDEINNEDVLCPDVCNEIDWAPDTREDIDKGFLFCCRLSEFMKVVPYLKNLNTGFEKIHDLLE